MNNQKIQLGSEQKNKTEPNIYPPIKNSALSYEGIKYITFRKNQVIFLKNFIFLFRILIEIAKVNFLNHFLPTQEKNRTKEKRIVENDFFTQTNP